MSDLRLVALFAIAVGSPVLARAQDARTYERRLDSLQVVARLAQLVIRDIDDSVRLEALRLDTVRERGITILAERHLSAFARQVIQLTLDSLGPRAATALPRISRNSFALREYHANTAWEIERMRSQQLPSDVVLTLLTPRGNELRSWRGPKTVPGVASAFKDHILRVLFLDGDRAFALWMGNRFPKDSLTTADWMGYRLSLVSSPTAVSRKCYAGDIGACAVVLDLTPVEDPVIDWYDPETRRNAVRAIRNTAEQQNNLQFLRCRAGSDSACVSVLRRLPPGQLAMPLQAGNRIGFVTMALMMGGEGAAQRLLEGGTPAQRITAAARVSMDSLLRTWQQNVQSARAPSRDLSPGIALLSVAWILGLGALSTRSSRWR